MAGMDDSDLEVGDRSGGAKQGHLRVDCALQDRLEDVIAGTGDCSSAPLPEILDIAAPEFGTKRDNDGESKKRRREKSTEKSVMDRERGKEGCQHRSSDHHTLSMDPRMWENLPGELLALVFSHLPVEQLLNKDWQQIILADSRLFHIETKMVCLITKGNRNLFWVRAWLVKGRMWHTSELLVSRPDVDFGEAPHPTMVAECEDGGLVCFVTSCIMRSKANSRKKNARCSLLFNVMNPLTGASRDVLPLSDMQETKLVRIQLDRETKQFRLLVVAEKLVFANVSNVSTGWTVDGVTAQVYDSVTRVWTAADECLSSISALNHPRKVTYDFTNGRLFTIDDGILESENIGRLPDYMYSLYKERLFALKLGSNGPAVEESANQSPTYFIEEFHWVSGLWVKVKTHRCEPFEHPPEAMYRMRLLACQGFLMAFRGFVLMTPLQPNNRTRTNGKQTTRF